MRSFINKSFSAGLVVITSTLLPLSLAVAQGVEVSELNQLPAARVDGSIDSDPGIPLITIDRHVDENDLQDLLSDETVNINLGLQITPIDGLSVRADAWRLEVEETPASNNLGNNNWQSSLPQLYREDTAAAEFSFDRPFLGSNIKFNGIDVGASYVWDSSKVGQFSLTSKATYVYDFSKSNNLPQVPPLVLNDADLTGSPELQGSLTLTWQYGNHNASAVTNYFDSFKEIGNLNLEQINELVDNITTVDLKYGYSVKTGKRERAIISFNIGIQNIFDEKTTQILNNNSRIMDQSGRVAYGTIKYQF